MKHNIRTGVIGVGSMGKNHARVYSEMDVLGGIADSMESVAKPLADKFGVDYFPDYLDLLKSDIEAVTVATPTSTHFKIAMDAIKAGKHVLVEKPICFSIGEAEELVVTAEKEGIVLAVGQIERHNPVVKFAKDSLTEGRFGDVVSIAARRVSTMPGRIHDVGVLMDLGIHDIDVIRYLAGSPVRSVYALGGKRQNDIFEDHANVLLEFENGIEGFVEVNWLTPMKVRRISITCLKSFVELDYMKQSADISSSQVSETYDSGDLYRLPIEFDIRHVSLKKQEPLRNEQEDFLDSITNNRTPLISGRDGTETLKVCQAALRSINEGKKIVLER
ncbi:MAG: Gfo/Idh/MocA family oxidoreductase [Candidatus Thermoplasmatota archaeon]|nr:Gfo/Idh/MocA family oxidoreductase [Euryarchaeota archaeon]MBU4032575.1 Gfo/Idh/MocA family oxidoreductase [Candidatus Thermoplasmatota archaeon]MBU4070578.1 Gfo/Idh/MocA family oxidoreductase [Candidatus Thermoplasmatota archaeon]MBU4144139.1 Gfo/Idh/MocA family oxidoreductase [Candidatus Thermoplasmatota archaeon]MBU4591167.1 Gfo/Idh/MocA family oxidoreductase [Candidatus Thermoplasmatota archaeon]